MLRSVLRVLRVLRSAVRWERPCAHVQRRQRDREGSWEGAWPPTEEIMQQQDERSEDRVRGVDELPLPFQDVFAGSFRYFNSLQSETFDDSFGTDDSLVISGPTGSGKTVVMELAILRLLSQSLTLDGTWIPPKGKLKTIYVAPLKALVQEKRADWSNRFGSLNVHCEEVSGDNFTETSWSKIHEADIILTTPEKLDSVTRKYKDRGGLGYFSDIGLVLLDEVHVLNSSRGAALEAVVSRLKMLSRIKALSTSPIHNLRFVAVSATIPNADDIGRWLDAPRHAIKVFGEEMRRVQLKTYVRGYQPGKNDFLFDRRLTDHVMENIESFGNGKPVLVFCATRKGTVDAAMKIAKQMKERQGLAKSNAFGQPELLEELQMNQIHNKQLQETLRFGVGFHSAGLDSADRATVESLFLNRTIKVLCATSTLAYGVNLPAYLVVIMGTKFYDHQSSRYLEYDVSDCLQMVGRAGRPQFESSAVAVIMTEKSSVARYQNLLAGAEAIESQLLHSLAEHVNAEIVLGTVTDIPSAIAWLKNSYLYVRIRKNPSFYGLRSKEIGDDRLLDRKLQETLLLKIIQELTKYGMIQADSDGFGLLPQDPGKLMANFYLRFRTMQHVTLMPPRASIPDLLMIVCLSEEFSGIRLRRSEKKTLNSINRNSAALKYRVYKDPHSEKVKERITSGAEKIFILVSFALSGHITDAQIEPTLRQESDHILQQAPRIAFCLEKYAALNHSLAAMANGIKLRKSIKARVWDGCNSECKQLPSITKQLSERLADHGCGILNQLVLQDPRKIETMTKRSYPFGNTVQSELSQFVLPAVEFQATTLQTNEALTTFVLKVKVLKDDCFTGTEAPAKHDHKAHILVGSLDDDKLLLHETVVVSDRECGWDFTVHTKPIEGKGRRLGFVAALISDSVVGVDQTAQFNLDDTQTRHPCMRQVALPHSKQEAIDLPMHMPGEPPTNLHPSKRVFADSAPAIDQMRKRPKAKCAKSSMLDVLTEKQATLLRATTSYKDFSLQGLSRLEHPNEMLQPQPPSITPEDRSTKEGSTQFEHRTLQAAKGKARENVGACHLQSPASPTEQFVGSIFFS